MGVYFTVFIKFDLNYYITNYAKTYLMRNGLFLSLLYFLLLSRFTVAYLLPAWTNTVTVVSYQSVELPFGENAGTLTERSRSSSSSLSSSSAIITENSSSSTSDLPSSTSSTELPLTESSSSEIFSITIP